ncbi:MAG TPA: GNVR domain-containing protein, partial [Salinimicrobium sp.]|nr:GNVR domain-containing protein [Salinimicrobium sp.]
MEELQEFSENEESNFDLKAEIYKYLAYWKWLVFGSLLGLSLAYLYNRYTVPVYYTQATMMVLRDAPNSVVGALPSGTSVLSLDDATLANQIETLTSKQLVENVVDALDLNITYFIEGNVITVEAYKDSPVRIKFLTPDSIVHKSNLNLFVTPQSATTYTLSIEEEDYSDTHKFGEAVQLEGLKFIILPREEDFVLGNTVNIRVNPLRQVANDFIARMQIMPKGKANDILSLAISGKEPQKSEDFLNALMKQFNQEGVADKRQVAENTTEFIQERLQIISGELDSVEGGIASFKKENQIMNVESKASQYLAKSSQAEQEIFDIETKLMVIESVKNALNSSEPYRLLPESLGLESGISGLISQYNKLVLERSSYLGSATPDNPIVKTLTEQLSSLRDNLLDNIERTKNSLNIQLRELNQLDRMAEGQFSNFPGLEKGIRSIKRQQEIKEQLYLFLLQRREEAAISSAATSPVAKVIDPAYTFNTPVDPKPGLILVGGFLVGLLIPLLVLFTKFFLDTKVHHKG